MTVDSPENNTENTLQQDKVEPNLTQQNFENSKTQENKEIDGKTEDPNWKAFREARKKDRADREAAQRRAIEKEAEVESLKAAMEAAFSKSTNVNPEQQYYSETQEETEDQRIEKKVQAAIAIREQALEKQRMERDQKELPQKLISAFPDYHQVVNEENGAYLEYHHPELYRAILRQPENFETCADIYKLVKKYVPNSTTSKRESAKADNNFNKPKSISSTGITQPGQSKSNAIISEERKAANWARMQALIKGVS